MAIKACFVGAAGAEDGNSWHWNRFTSRSPLASSSSAVIQAVKMRKKIIEINEDGESMVSGSWHCMHGRMVGHSIHVQVSHAILTLTTGHFLTCVILTLRVCPWAGNSCLLWLLVIIDVSEVGRHERFCRTKRSRLTSSFWFDFLCSSCTSCTIYWIVKKVVIAFTFSVCTSTCTIYWIDKQWIETSHYYRHTYEIVWEIQCHTFFFLGRSSWFWDLVVFLGIFLKFVGWALLVSFGHVFIFLAKESKGIGISTYIILVHLE